MQYTTLGNTGLIVSRMCPGTMTFGGGEGMYGVIGTVDQNGADQLAKLLDEVSELPPVYPGWMHAYQAADRSRALDRTDVHSVAQAAGVRGADRRA